MRHFELGDLVYLRRYNEQYSDWCIVDEHPYVVIETEDTVTVMGGRNGDIIRMQSAMLATEDEARAFKLCRETE